MAKAKKTSKKSVPSSGKKQKKITKSDKKTSKAVVAAPKKGATASKAARGAEDRDSKKESKTAAKSKEVLKKAGSKKEVSKEAPKEATKEAKKTKKDVRPLEEVIEAAAQDKKVAKKPKAAPPASKKAQKEEIDLPEMEDFEGSEDIPDLDDVEDFDTEIEDEVDEPEEQEEPVRVTAQASKQDSSEVILTDAEGRRLCKVPNCDQVSMVDTYCRYHYLLFWKRIQVRKKILSEGKLEKYIEELTGRYPMKYLEMLKKDLRTQQDFMSAIHELEIDDSGAEGEFEDEAQSYIEEVRGISGSEGEQDEEY